MHGLGLCHRGGGDHGSKGRLTGFAHPLGPPVIAPFAVQLLALVRREHRLHRRFRASPDVGSTSSTSEARVGTAEGVGTTCGCHPTLGAVSDCDGQQTAVLGPTLRGGAILVGTYIRPVGQRGARPTATRLRPARGHGAQVAWGDLVVGLTKRGVQRLKRPVERRLRLLVTSFVPRQGTVGRVRTPSRVFVQGGQTKEGAEPRSVHTGWHVNGVTGPCRLGGVRGARRLRYAFVGPGVCASTAAKRHSPIASSSSLRRERGESSRPAVQQGGVLPRQAVDVGSGQPY